MLTVKENKGKGRYITVLHQIEDTNKIKEIFLKLYFIAFVQRGKGRERES